MQEPQIRGECDFIELHWKDIDSAAIEDHPMRCSVCKNRFYCSAECQKKDWKHHKWNCSALGADGVPAATVVAIDEEFKVELKRVFDILKEMDMVLKNDKSFRPSPSLLPTLLQICADLPERLRYPGAIQDKGVYRYRLPIITACRLLLISYVSTLNRSDSEKKQYEDFFAKLPPMNHLASGSCAELYGPKITTRPADLSSGEYRLIAGMTPMWIASREDDSDVCMEWVWLMGVMKRVWDVKSG
ncbi:hypothetical protein FB45DRAFT_803107 [Roridomyces roridus]|uniref:MYND-type domain-containing protein n=1 Tax=Roridomyces roridus TaxID=1738132 RepID=A0AAD7B8S8_9AGAR|nr:hypothetical protein FB45DRAFT_803107 [Roridomyces roridus]